MISPDLQRNFKMFGGKVRLENPWLKVIDYKTKTDERDGRYTVVERKNSVVIVLEHPEHGFLLVKSYRYPIGEALWEFPAGGIEKGETPLAAATRELWEEAGIHVGLREIGSFFAWAYFAARLRVLWKSFRLGGRTNPTVQTTRRRIVKLAFCDS